MKPNELEINHETAVLDRYSDAAKEVENCLCSPFTYDKALLEVGQRVIQTAHDN